MINKKNIPLILSFSIPILMIIFVAGIIYIPGLFLSPKYNFLYSVNEDYYGSRTYSVRNGRLIQNPQPTPVYYEHRLVSSPQLYVHDVKTNESVPISFQEAASLNLDSNYESPDGYKIASGNNSGGFFSFFWYDRDYNAKYIVGHNLSKKLNLRTDGSSYYNSIHFLGWIIP